jgi:hypothetical protein
MARTTIPNRRAAITRKINFNLASEKVIPILVTVGFNEYGKVCEVFCADFKVGSDTHAIVIDACIMLSRLFQFGDSPADVVKSLTSNSLIKTLAQVAAEEDQ